MISTKAKISGQYRIEATSPDGSSRVLADWFPNLITDIGINRYNVGTWGTGCYVGSSSTAPNVTDTQLGSLVGSTTDVQENTTGAEASSPYFGWRRVRYRFAAGVATGNLSEVGVGWGSTTLFSRALILDGAGSPTTISVAADEVLDVTYELRLYPLETDSTFSITDSETSVEHTCTSRAASVTSGSVWCPISYSNGGLSPTSSGVTAYNGSIGAITSTPSGSSATSTSTTINSYSNNSFERTYTSTWGLNDGNLAGGITSIVFNANSTGAGSGRWQIGITPAINKNNTKTLTINWKHTWVRG